MPSFGTKSLLVAFAVAAVWLSTFSGYLAAPDVRRSILLVILIASGAVAVYSRERRRAFWSAFAFVMFVCGGLTYERPLYRYVPELTWMNAYSFGASQVDNTPIATTPMPATTPAPPAAADDLFGPGPSGPTMSPYNPQPPVPGLTIRDAFIDTGAAGWTITLAAIAGFIAAYIYGQQPISARESQ